MKTQEICGHIWDHVWDIEIRGGDIGILGEYRGAWVVCGGIHRGIGDVYMNKYIYIYISIYREELRMF